MKDLFKGKIATILVVIATLVLAGVAIFTAVRLYQLRQQSISPTGPERSSASEGAKSCKTLTFTLTEDSPTPTTTSGTPTPTSEISTGTPTPTRPPSVPEPPVCTAEKPSAPTITSVTRSGSSATLTWTKVEKATHYTISYGTSATNLEYGVPNTGNVSSYKINELNPSAKYYFTIYAVNDCMPSNASAVVSTTTGGSGSTGTVSQALPSSGNSLPTIASFAAGIGLITFALLLAI
jgi:hypothetical protein